MASLEDYEKHMNVLKVEQKIARTRRELETVNYGDDCPIGGENDCANIRMAFDRGYIDGLHDALSMLGVVKAENSSEKPNDCETCKHNKLEWYSEICDSCCGNNNHYEPKTEPFDKDTNVRSKDEPKLSEIPTSKCHYEPKDEPQTERSNDAE